MPLLPRRTAGLCNYPVWPRGLARIWRSNAHEGQGSAESGLPEENEPNITPARSALRLGSAWVWLFCAGVAAGVGGLLVAGLPYPPWQPPPPANHRISAP